MILQTVKNIAVKAWATAAYVSDAYSLAPTPAVAKELRRAGWDFTTVCSPTLNYQHEGTAGSAIIPQSFATVTRTPDDYGRQGSPDEIGDFKQAQKDAAVRIYQRRVTLK